MIWRVKATQHPSSRSGRCGPRTRNAQDWGQENTQKQAMALLLCLSKETIKVVENLGLSDAQMKDSGVILDALETHIRGQVNETVARRDLRKRTQEAAETVNDFVVAVRNLVTTCNFCNEECEQKAIKDQLIGGLNDGDAVEELLRIKDLTLTQAMDLATAVESAKKSRDHLKGIDVCRTNRNKGNHEKSHGSSSQRREESGYDDGVTCRKCGREEHTGGKNCPAKHKWCNECGKKGHFASVCENKAK